MLEACYGPQVHDIEATISHGTGTKKEGVDISQVELVLGIARVAIDSAAIDDDGGKKDGEDEVVEMQPIEVETNVPNPRG